MSLLSQLRQVASRLNPAEIRQLAERRLFIKLQSASDAGYDALFNFLLPETLSIEKRRRLAERITLEGEPGASGSFDLILADRSIQPAPDAFLFDPDRGQVLINDILEQREALSLPLARMFPPFRDAVSRRAIQQAATENAVFSIVTALPNIAPYAGLVWTPAEFASDSAFLTLNQLRMLFQLGAANDRSIGFGEQKSEIGSIVAGAFGWRALARELAAKIPAGGGVIPKAAIAFAGTWVLGASLERLYRIGYGFTRAERSAAYEEAFERGKQTAAMLLERWRKR
jgi:hypothetical protein